MSINLKSFQKLFFIIFFSVISLSLMCSDELVNLPNKIAPELERIEALPRRTKPAELNIEVTKIKSEVLNEVYIYIKIKNIYVDFSQKKAETLKNVKTIEDLENKYNLVVTETLKSSGLVKGKQKNKIMDNSPVIKYELATFEGEKVLKIPFENEPEKLYITVEESASKNIVKVYSLDIKNALTRDPRGIIETKTVIINLSKGIETYNNKTLVFDSNGNLSTTGIDNENPSNISTDEVEVIKQSGFPGVDGFINSINAKGHTTTVTISSKTGTSNPLTGTKSYDEQLELQLSINTPNHEVFVFKYYRNGELSLRFQQINSTGPKSYTFNITHTSTNGSIKEHTLIINANIISEKEATITYFKGYNDAMSMIDTTGKPSRTDIKVEKNNFSEGFINGLDFRDATYITVQQIDTNGNNVRDPVSLGRTLGSNIPTELDMDDVKISFNGNDGALSTTMKSIDNTKSYRYKITHRNSNSATGTVVRKDILNIQSVLPITSAPSMIRTNNLNEFVIEDDIESETYKILSSDFGDLLMEQTNLVQNREFFPLVALGNKIGDNGWEFSQLSTNSGERGDVITNFQNEKTNPLNMKMYFEREPLVNRGNEISLGTPKSVLGIFEENSLEKIKVKLKADIQNSEEEIKQILSSFRKNPEREMYLKNPEPAENSISYSIGEVLNGKYNAVMSGEVAAGDVKIESINYPKIKIVKPLLKEKLILTLQNTEITTIQFNKDGVDKKVGITSDKKRYLKSLHYDSLFSINDGNMKNISNGESEPYDLTINNGDDFLVLRVQYKNRYPEFQILSFSKPGTYNLKIRHFDPVENTRLSVEALKRQEFDMDIVVNSISESTKEFEVTSSMRDIVILPPIGGEPAKVEYPDNWVEVTQLVPDKEKFPVIGINRPSWVIETDRPLNPIDKKPTAILDLGGDKIEVPVNIRETPYQNTQKFFVYDRGDMTNRNIAIGAYTPISSTIGTGLNNLVKGDFEVVLKPEVIQKILAYAATKTEDRVVIPYSNTLENDHKIYSIKGLQSSTSKIFKVNETNILAYGTIDFPRIVVQKTDEAPQNTATLQFSNPVPKSTGDISGTFDIMAGAIPPNNLVGYSHPSSLTVLGTTVDWQGFTIIPEYHKIKISSSIETKEFTTTELGEMKGTQIITSGNNKYLFMKGKNSPLAIGILAWDFQSKIDDKITLEHLNSNGRVVHKDVYSISLELFSPSRYLDVTNSSLMTSRGSNKDLAVTANSRQDFIDLGTLKLQNYEKDITKTGTLNSTTGLYENEVRIEVFSDLITLNLSSDPSSTAKLKGKLVFDNEKTMLSSPNENRSLRFELDSSNDSESIAGKTFTITKPNNKSLITIKGGGKEDVILEKLTLTLKDGVAGALPEMSFVSTLTSLTVKEESILNGITAYKIPGKMTLRQLTGGQGNSVPAIAIGDRKDWLREGGDRRYNKIDRATISAAYIVGNKTISVTPELINPRNTVDGGLDINGKIIPRDQIKLYTEAAGTRILTALTWVTNRNTRNERITTELKLNILQPHLAVIMEELKNIPGDRVELKPASTVLTDFTNKAKIAYIHARDTGSSGDISEGNKLYIPTNTTLSTKFAYESLPSIFIEKENLYKNLEINLLPTYVLDGKITFNSSGISLPAGVNVNQQDNRVLEGLSYKHTIRLTLPGGEIKEYTTNEAGATTGVITETVEKNGKSITLNIRYTDGKTAEVWISGRSGSQFYDFVLQHIDPSGDVRRTSNIRINSGVEGSTTKVGEMNLVISSRYNAADGQLNSNPLVITSTGITYQSEVLDLKLLNGDYPEWLGESKTAYINGGDISTFPNSEITLGNGTVLRVTKEGNGDLKIKPLKWNYNSTDEFILDYKDSSNNIVNQYKFNVKCPEFFVASIGQLDFGKIYKIGNPADKTVTTNIELEYNSGTIQADYSLDVSQPNSDGSLTDSLYLNDDKTLLVKNLSLESEITNSVNTAKRTLPLTGTIDGNSVKSTLPGVYQKTIQILIHLK
ncbi:MAG: hypothetical protein ACRC0V_07795 [Fusobacteriaceae bacterium]